MDYLKKIKELLEDVMTEKGFKLWQAIDDMLPDIWDKPTSSSGRWHQKEGGRVPSNAEHVYGMLYAAEKSYRLFIKTKPKSSYVDSLFMSIVFHDSLKYGDNGQGRKGHTLKEHDKLAGDMIEANRSTFLKVLQEDDFERLVESVRFHSGRWSTDANPYKFTFNEHSEEAMFVHLLDMLDSNNCIKFPETD